MKKTLSLISFLIVIIFGFLYEGCNKVYAQECCGSNCACKINSDCQNNGTCQFNGLTTSICNCVVSSDSFLRNGDQYNDPITYYGRNCENAFTCDHSCIGGNNECIYIDSATEAATGWMSGCLCGNSNDFSMMELVCPNTAARITLNKQRLNINKKFTGTWVGELPLIRSSNGTTYEHAIFKICARSENEIEIVADSSTYFQDAFYAGNKVLASEKEIMVLLTNRSGNKIRTIISLLKDNDAFVILSNGEHFIIKKIDSHSYCKIAVRKGITSITKDEFNF